MLPRWLSLGIGDVGWTQQALTMESRSLLTGLPGTASIDGRDRNLYCFDEACGDYAIQHDAFDFRDTSIIRKLACVLAQRKLRLKQHGVFVTKATRGPKSPWIQIPATDLLAEYPQSGAAMLDEALINLSLLTDHPSDPIEVTRERAFLVYGYDLESTHYMVGQLTEMHRIGSAGFHLDSGNVKWPTVRILARGWDRLSELRLTPAGGIQQAFVAMWFDPSMQGAYQEGIKPAVESCGFRCVRIDGKEHNNKICDEIIAEIRRSTFVVADFTGNRGGVYFEAGFAQGIHLPVIWTVNCEGIDLVHFDTRQYNHITYSTPAELCEKLTNRIRATIPEGPSKPSDRQNSR